VKESKVFFRSFDPVEIPRFATISTIMEATSSAGIVIPLLAPHVDDSSRHNLRAAYLAGIGHGLNRPTMLLQRDYSTVPADYRDFVLSVSSEKDIKDNVVEFAKNAIICAQSIRTAQPRVGGLYDKPAGQQEAGRRRHAWTPQIEAAQPAAQKPPPPPQRPPQRDPPGAARPAVSSFLKVRGSSPRLSQVDTRGL